MAQEIIRIHRVHQMEERLVAETGWRLRGGRPHDIGEPVLLETKEYFLPEGYRIAEVRKGTKEVVSPEGQVCCMVLSMALEGDVPALATPDGKGFRLQEMQR